MRTNIEFSEEIETKIISLDYLKIKDELDDPDFQATIRAAYEEPAVINVDNLLDMEIVEDLRLSLSEKERVFRDNFLDNTKLKDERIDKAKNKADEIITDFSTKLFGYNISKNKGIGIRNMISKDEPMHFDGYHSKCGETPFMAIYNFDIKPRLWNVSITFPDLLRKHEAEMRDIFKRKNNDTSPSIKLRDEGPIFNENLMHKIAFAPNSIWYSNPKIMSHQLVYGGGILIKAWPLDEPECKCQICLLKKFGYPETAEQYIRMCKRKNMEV